MKIKLEELATALGKSDILPGYVDLAEGRVIMLRDDWQDDAALEHALRLEDDFNRYVPLINICDSDEYGVMQAFAERQPANVCCQLKNALAGQGVSLRFLQQVKQLQLRQAWDDFWHAHLIDAARFFCEENEIEYEE